MGSRNSTGDVASTTLPYDIGGQLSGAVSLLFEGAGLAVDASLLDQLEQAATKRLEGPEGLIYASRGLFTVGALLVQLGADVVDVKETAGEEPDREYLGGWGGVACRGVVTVARDAFVATASRLCEFNE